MGFLDRVTPWTRDDQTARPCAHPPPPRLSRPRH